MKVKNKIKFLPNVITAFGLSCGLFVIHSMSLAAPLAVDQPLLLKMTALLIIAGFADVLDGALARVLKSESSFGSLFDVLSDAITFGVGPTIIVQKTLSLPPGSKLSFLLMAASLIFCLCGVVRLVRFNLTSMALDIEQESGNKNFTGLPIPGAAGMLVSLNLVTAQNGIIEIPDPYRACLLGFSMVTIGYFMVSGFKFPSFKTLPLFISFRSVFITVTVAVGIFYGLMFYLDLFAFLATWGYFLTALSLSLLRMWKGKQSKILEDFEPESEDLNWDN
jgi:CDP-diacylglycerol---serine O-phosphatidyltransferase